MFSQHLQKLSANFPASQRQRQPQDLGNRGRVSESDLSRDLFNSGKKEIILWMVSCEYEEQNRRGLFYMFLVGSADRRRKSPI